MASPLPFSVSRPAIDPTIVTSSPSRIQTVPRPMTTSQCQRAHGRRSMRAGIFVSIVRSSTSVAMSPPVLLGWTRPRATPSARTGPTTHEPRPGERPLLAGPAAPAGPAVPGPRALALARGVPGHGARAARAADVPRGAPQPLPRAGHAGLLPPGRRRPREPLLVDVAAAARLPAVRLGRPGPAGRPRGLRGP